MLIGHGWDLHQHSENKTLKLGGVNFDEQGFEGHSDGDILLHALCIRDSDYGIIGDQKASLAIVSLLLDDA